MSQQGPQSTSTPRILSIIGAVCGVVGLLLFPIVGIIGAILGFVAYAKGDKPLGLYVGIGSIVATVIGFVIGAIIISNS